MAPKLTPSFKRPGRCLKVHAHPSRPYSRQTSFSQAFLQNWEVCAKEARQNWVRGGDEKVGACCRDSVPVWAWGGALALVLRAAAYLPGEGLGEHLPVGIERAGGVVLQQVLQARVGAVLAQHHVAPVAQLGQQEVAAASPAPGEQPLAIRHAFLVPASLSRPAPGYAVCSCKLGSRVAEPRELLQEVSLPRSFALPLASKPIPCEPRPSH